MTRSVVGSTPCWQRLVVGGLFAALEAGWRAGLFVKAGTHSPPDHPVFAQLSKFADITGSLV